MQRFQLRWLSHATRLFQERLARHVLLVKSWESGPEVDQRPELIFSGILSCLSLSAAKLPIRRYYWSLSCGRLAHAFVSTAKLRCTRGDRSSSHVWHSSSHVQQSSVQTAEFAKHVSWNLRRKCTALKASKGPLNFGKTLLDGQGFGEILSARAVSCSAANALAGIL